MKKFFVLIALVSSLSLGCSGGDSAAPAAPESTGTAAPAEGDAAPAEGEAAPAEGEAAPAE